LTSDFKKNASTYVNQHLKSKKPYLFGVILKRNSGDISNQINNTTIST